MTLALVDTSVWARQAQGPVAAELAGAIEANEVAVTAPLVLELLTAARSAREYEDLAREYDELIQLRLDASVEVRARAVQAALAQRGQHRGPTPVALLVAAAAEGAGAELWHCDRHFDLIAAVTGQPVRRLGR